MTDFTLRVIDIIKSIPSGSVMTYGQVAELAGNRRAARQVARILHSMSSNHELPWHRVVGSGGRVSLKDDHGRSLQRQLLEEEGVVFEGDRVVLNGEKGAE